MITSLCWTVSQYWAVSGEMIFITQCRGTNIKPYLQRRKSRRREEIYLVQWSLILCVRFYLKWKCMSTAAVSGLIVSDCVSPLVTTVSPWQHSSWLSLSLHQPLTCEQTMLTRSGACIALQNIVAITKHKWSLYKLCVWQSVFCLAYHVSWWIFICCCPAEDAAVAADIKGDNDINDASDRWDVERRNHY